MPNANGRKVLNYKVTPHKIISKTVSSCNVIIGCGIC